MPVILGSQFEVNSGQKKKKKKRLYLKNTQHDKRESIVMAQVVELLPSKSAAMR
jgi:hypothetical protein